MISNNLIDNINEVKKIISGVGIAVSIEEDKNLTGLFDCIIELGDFSLERSGDINQSNFIIDLTLSAPKKNWSDFLRKIMVLSQLLGSDNHYIFDGFVKQQNTTKLIYTGRINFKGYLTEINIT